MSTWIDLPAHRVLKLDYWEFKHDFTMVDHQGQEIGKDSFAIVYRVIRNSDRKVFRLPRFHPATEDASRTCYLEEI